MKLASYSLLALTLIALVFTGAISCGSGSGGGGSNPNPHPGPSPSVTCDSSQRDFLFTNNTSETIWLGITAGTISCLSDSDCPTAATGSCVGENAAAGTAGVCGCASNTQCGSIAQCNTSNNHCYFNLPSLTTAQMNIAAGATSNVCFPAAQSGKNIQWSGNVFARTGCDSNGQNCKTGECGNAANQPCPTGTGGNPPATLAEFTLSNQAVSSAGPDYYDISMINGINVGLMMSPKSGTFTADIGNAYSCGTPGNTSAVSPLSACSWTITPTVSSVDQTSLLRNVFPSTITGTCPGGGAPNSLGYCECTQDSDCSSQSLVCGLAQNAVVGEQYAQVCGTGIGWWTTDQICNSSDGTSPDIAAMNCNSTNNQLYGCTGSAAQSCYNNAANGSCCGCATSASSPDVASWPSILSPDFGGSDNGCYSTNTDWYTVALPWLVFLKQACPTAYTYPYDDATSTFTCEGTSSLAPDYNITFVTTQ